jgi:hypothetical protein
VVRIHAAVAGSLTIVFSRWWMTGDTSSTNKCSAEWELCRTNVPCGGGGVASNYQAAAERRPDARSGRLFPD